MGVVAGLSVVAGLGVMPGAVARAVGTGAVGVAVTCVVGVAA